MEKQNPIRQGYLDQVFNDLTVYANELKAAFVAKFPAHQLVCLGDPSGDEPDLPHVIRFTHFTYDETTGEPYHERQPLYGAYHDGSYIVLVSYLWDAPWQPHDTFALEQEPVTLDCCEVLETLLLAKPVPTDNLRAKLFRKTYNLT